MVKLSLANGKFIYMKDKEYTALDFNHDHMVITLENRVTIIDRISIVSIEIFEPHPIYGKDIIYNKITTKDIE